MIQSKKINLTSNSRVLFQATFAQPWVLIDFSWGLLASLPGLLFGFINLIFGAQIHRPASAAIEIRNAPLMLPGYGVSLGPVLIGGRGFADFGHEYGHTLQNRILGPFYYPVVAIPSILSVCFKPRNHHRLYCERWADAWSQNYSKSSQQELKF